MSEIKFDGNKLFKVRKLKKFTQEKLAKEIGVTRQTIYLWETNQKSPDIEKISKICNVLNIDISELIDGTRENSETEKEKNEEINTIGNKEKIVKSSKKYLKIILVLLVIIFLIYVIYSTIKFVKLNKILNKWNSLDNTKDYYIEIDEYLVDNFENDVSLENYFYEKYYHDGILKIIKKDRKKDKIQSIIIYNFNNGIKYIIYDDLKLYQIGKIENNNELSKIKYNFDYFTNYFSKNFLDIYFFSYNLNFNIYFKEDIEIIVKNKFKLKLNKDNYLVNYEEISDNTYKELKKYYSIKLNSDKDFEIDLEEYLKNFKEIK